MSRAGVGLVDDGSDVARRVVGVGETEQLPLVDADPGQAAAVRVEGVVGDRAVAKDGLADVLNRIRPFSLKERRTNPAPGHLFISGRIAVSYIFFLWLLSSLFFLESLKSLN